MLLHLPHLDYIGGANELVMDYIVMAHIVTAYVVMAYVVMAYAVMATICSQQQVPGHGPSLRLPQPQAAGTTGTLSNHNYIYAIIIYRP